MARTLDLGCGAAPKNPFSADEAFGVDLEENPARNIKKADLSVEPIPYESDVFDYVTAFDFLEHVPRVAYVPERRNPFVEVMNEICRVLKMGGTFLSFTPAYPHAAAFQDPTHVNIITPETFALYFDNVNTWASAYGYYGSLRIMSQEWRGAHLLTLAQKVPMRPELAFSHLERAWKLADRATALLKADPAGGSRDAWYSLFVKHPLVDLRRTLPTKSSGEDLGDIILKTPYALQFRAESRDWIVTLQGQIDFGPLPPAADFQEAYVVLFNEAYAQMANGFWAEAEAGFRRLLAAQPSLWQVQEHLARIAEQTPARLDETAAWLRRAAALNPEPAPVLLRCGDVLMRAGQWTEAGDVLDAYLRHVPDDPKAMFRRRVARTAAASDDLAARRANDVIVLNRQKLEAWRQAPDLAEIGLGASPDGSTPAFEYEVVDGDSWSNRTRPAPHKGLTDRRLLILGGASIAQAGYFEGGLQRWHFDTVVRLNDTAIPSYGTPVAMANSLYANLYADDSGDRVFFDMQGAKVLPMSEDAPVLMLDNVYNYGHWMLDELPKLRLYEQAGLLNGETRIYAARLTPWQRQTIADLGLTERLIALPASAETATYLHFMTFRNLVLATEPSIAERIAFLRGKFLPHASPLAGAPERVFISRKNQQSTRIRNEHELAAFLEERGFAVIAPEELTLHDQIAVYKNAKLIVSATGSAYTNLVFASPGATYLELTSRRVLAATSSNMFHYHMFGQLGIRQVVAVYDNLDRVGAESWPISDAYAVDLSQLDRVLSRL